MHIVDDGIAREYGTPVRRAVIDVLLDVLLRPEASESHREAARALAAIVPFVLADGSLEDAVNLLTGIRVAASLAVISALVAEYFGGPSDGIGTAIASKGRKTKNWAMQQRQATVLAQPTSLIDPNFLTISPLYIRYRA